MNLGEFYHASKDAVEQVLDALPRTALGHLYMDTGKGIQTLSRDQAKAAQAQLTKNRQEGQYQCMATQPPRAVTLVILVSQPDFLFDSNKYLAHVIHGGQQGTSFWR
jgi:hypothetical protein